MQFMNTLRIPKVINFGKDALSEAEYPKNALVVTTAPPALSGKWLDRMGIEDYMLYDKVTPEPSINDKRYQPRLCQLGTCPRGAVSFFHQILTHHIQSCSIHKIRHLCTSSKSSWNENLFFAHLWC